MNCPNCNTNNPADEQFCSACGTELTGAAPSPAPAPQQTVQAAALPTIVAAPPPAPTTPVLVTLSVAGKDYPLSDGGKLVIARADTDKCTPDIGITADTVSSTPVEVTAQGGVVTVRDTGTSTGMRVVVYVAPGGSMEVKPGDMIMLGDQVIAIG